MPVFECSGPTSYLLTSVGFWCGVLVMAGLIAIAETRSRRSARALYASAERLATALESRGLVRLRRDHHGAIVEVGPGPDGPDAS